MSNATDNARTRAKMVKHITGVIRILHRPIFGRWIRIDWDRARPGRSFFAAINHETWTSVRVGRLIIDWD